MPVNTTHPQYDSHVPKWKRERDVLDGTDAVKGAKTIYLPKPNGHTDEDFTGYVMRAEFYPATQRTVDGLTGAIFRKDPVVEVPSEHEELLKGITLKGNDLITYAKSVVREVLSVGRYGALVDIMDGNDTPFIASYSTENIINWRISYIERQPVLTLLVLRENVTQPKTEDPYTTEVVEQYRVLQLGVLEGDDTGALVYAQTTYQKQQGEGGKESFVQTGQSIPQRRGEFLNRIPFVFFGPLDLSADVQKSPILDLVDVNLSHYRTSAELEEGAYFTGLPMYVISGRVQGGEDDGPAVFSVGSRSALILEEGGTADILTVSGEGMGLLKDMMEDKEGRMAILGARILEDQKAGVEAAATVAMRHRGEDSLLASIADTTSRGLAELLRTMIWWTGTDNPDVSVQLNKDFVSATMAPSEIVQLTAAFQAGTIGPEVFFKALKDGERVPDGWTLKDWEKDVEEGADFLDRGMGNDFEDEESSDEEDGEDGS